MTAHFSNETYKKMGCPDLNDVIYIMNKHKQKVYGKICFIDSRKGKVVIKIIPRQKTN
jgi:hypothetical protein